MLKLGDLMESLIEAWNGGRRGFFLSQTIFSNTWNWSSLRESSPSESVSAKKTSLTIFFGSEMRGGVGVVGPLGDGGGYPSFFRFPFLGALCNVRFKFA